MYWFWMRQLIDPVLFVWGRLVASLRDSAYVPSSSPVQHNGCGLGPLPDKFLRWASPERVETEGRDVVDDNTRVGLLAFSLTISTYSTKKEFFFEILKSYLFKHISCLVVCSSINDKLIKKSRSLHIYIHLSIHFLSLNMSYWYMLSDSDNRCFSLISFWRGNVPHKSNTL